MKEFLERFPGLGRKIFNQLDNQDLIKCKEVSRYQCKFLEDDRLVWTRVIKKYNANHVEFKDAWKLVVDKVPVEIVKEIAIATKQFYTVWPQRVKDQHQHSPHHIAGEYGCLSLCKFIVQKTRSLNPEKPDEFKGLHYAARKEHLEICKFFIADLEDKNPKDKHGLTLLHHAAHVGNLDIYKLIAEQVEDKNPISDSYCRSTLLHDAVQSGNYEIIRYIMSVTDDQNKNPRNSYGITPLHYAASEGCLDIYKLIAEQLDDKYPSTNDGELPIHFAAQWGSYEVCKFIIENGGNPNPTLNTWPYESALDLAGTNGRIRDLILQKCKENPTSTI